MEKTTFLLYIAIFFVLAMVALIATIRVGISKENKEGNPVYDQRTASNWLRLTVIIVLAGIIGITIMVRTILS